MNEKSLNEKILNKNKISEKNKLPEKNRKKNDDCLELKNIQYKTMLLSGKEGLVSPLTKSVENIDKFLDNEIKLNKKEPWNKLDRSQKIEKLNNYIDLLKKNHSLTNQEIINLKKYFVNCLDRKSLNKVKDVEYEKEDGIIVNIPLLKFNDNTRKFTLKKCDKHVSASKSLAPKNKKKTKVKKDSPIK